MNNTRLKQARAAAKALDLTLLRLKGRVDGISWYSTVPRRRAGLPLAGFERVSLGCAEYKLHEMRNYLTVN
jgi:hypothetical protein